MKKVILFLGLILLLTPNANAYMHPAEAKMRAMYDCRGLYVNMVKHMLYLQENGIPIESAHDVIDDVVLDDPNAYLFLRATLLEIYKNPAYIEKILRDGTWVEKCSEAITDF